MTTKPSKTSERELSQGDIVVVPFPYSDQLAEKRRPALVVTKSSFNKRNGLVWVAMITSAMHEPQEDDVTLTQEASGLPKSSRVRASKIATIEPSRVLRKLKTLDGKTFAKVQARLLRAIS